MLFLGGLCGTVEGLSRLVLPRVPWGPNLGQSGGGHGGVQSPRDRTCEGPINRRSLAGGRPTRAQGCGTQLGGALFLPEMLAGALQESDLRWAPDTRLCPQPGGLGTRRGRCACRGSLASGQGWRGVLLGDLLHQARSRAARVGGGVSWGSKAWEDTGSGQWGAVSSCSELVGVSEHFCVPTAAPPTCRGLRGPGGAHKERAPPTRGSAASVFPECPGLPASARAVSPAAGPWGYPLLSQEDLATSRGYQPSPRDSTACPRSPRVCVLGGRQDRGHGPGTHGLQGAQPGPHVSPVCRQETGWEGRGLAPPEADGQTAHLSFGGSPSPPWWAGWPAGPDPGPAWLPSMADPPRRALWLRGALRGSERTTAVDGLPFSVLMNGCRALKPQHRSLLPSTVGESRASAFRRPCLPAPARSLPAGLLRQGPGHHGNSDAHPGVHPCSRRHKSPRLPT